MKLVKLQKNRRLYKQGFTHAFEFTDWMDDEYPKVIRSLRRIYNDRRWRGRYYAWEVDSTTHRIKEGDNVWGTRWTTILIGIRSEAVGTQILLMM